MGACVARHGHCRRQAVRRTLLILVALVGAGAPFFVPPHRAAAQWIPASGWTEPLNVSNSVTASNDPTIVADAYGMVHVFWSEYLDGEPLAQGQAPGAGNAIMYRRLGPDGWTPAIDIFYAGELGRMTKPAAVVDQGGYLNLVWIEFDGLYYSYAPSWQADRPQAWAEPIRIEEGTVAEAKVLDLEDRQMVVYSLTAGPDQGLFGAVLTDRWPQEYVTIWHGVGKTAPQGIAATVHQKGRIHLAWEVARPPDPEPFELWYGFSQGTDPLQFDNRLVTKATSDDTSLQFARPWLAVRGADEVHLQWAQGSSTFRWHQFSADGGRTWIEPYQIWPDLISQTNSQAAGADSSGTLYWVDVFRYPSGAYLTHWTEHGWERPEMFYLKYRTATDRENENLNVHYIQMAISQGNHLHIVFLDLDRGEVWHMRKSLPAPAVAPRLLPTGTPTPLPQPAPEGPTAPAGTPIPEGDGPATPQEIVGLPAEFSASTGGSFAPGQWLMAGVAPVLLLLVVVVVARFKLK